MLARVHKRSAFEFREVLCCGVKSFFAHPIDELKRAELCWIGGELLIGAENKWTDRVLVCCMGGADVASLCRTPFDEMLTHVENYVGQFVA